MATPKQYIGSGKGHPTYDSVTVTLNMDAAVGAMFTTDKGTFLRFVVSRRQQPDQFGKTHACFFIPQEKKAVEAPAKGRRRKGNLSQSA
jgi:hypothetical protein